MAGHAAIRETRGTRGRSTDKLKKGINTLCYKLFTHKHREHPDAFGKATPAGPRSIGAARQRLNNSYSNTGLAGLSL